MTEWEKLKADEDRAPLINACVNQGIKAGAEEGYKKALSFVTGARDAMKEAGNDSFVALLDSMIIAMENNREDELANVLMEIQNDACLRAYKAAEGEVN